MSRRSIVLSLISLLTLFTGLAGTVAAQGTPSAGGNVPANLTPSPSSVMIFDLDASGFQIYACEPDPNDASAYAWAFKGPEADLFNSQGAQVGIHFGGPTWQAADGSAVVGAVLERADSPDVGAIPWLLLDAQEHTGTGLFSTVTHIQRLDTVGGVAPAEGCDGEHEGDEARVPYKATYAFFFAVTTDAATPAS